MSEPPPMPPQGIPPEPIPVGYSSSSPIRTSGMAVTSLVFGVILCFPLVTGLLAISFGWIGIKVTKNPSLRGRGLAIAGLVLGILNLGFWGVGSTVWWVASKPERILTHRFVNELGQGNNAAALADCAPTITADQMKGLIAWFQKQGKIQSTMITGSYVGTNLGTGTTGNVACTVHFADGHNALGQITMIEQQGVWKVNSGVAPFVVEGSVAA